MKESEAIEKLKNMRLYMQIEDENNDCKFTEDDYKANEMAIQTLEKQIPQKPKTDDRYVMYICPCCNNFIKLCKNYCENCGQKLDWEDDDE